MLNTTNGHPYYIVQPTMLIGVFHVCSPSFMRQIRGGNGGLLRCGKGTTWEGGQRVPAIAWWPGKIRTGKTVEVWNSLLILYQSLNHNVFCLLCYPCYLQIAGTVDIFPTLMNLVGGKLPNVTMDGVDMAPILFDNKKVHNYCETIAFSSLMFYVLVLF